MIVRNKNILNCKWIVDGTIISVGTIVNALYSDGIDWILENYPTITINDIADCLNCYIKNKKLGGK